MAFADLTDVRCRYEIMGSGDPLLMIAGLGSTCETWADEADELAKHFTLILLDNRSIGESISQKHPQCLEDLASDCVELIEYLQLDKAHVLGLSLGGIIAQRLAIDHPSRIDRLVLVSCTNRWGPYLRQMGKILEMTLRKFPIDMFHRTMEALSCSAEFFDSRDGQVATRTNSAGNSLQQRLAVARQLRCVACEEVAAGKDYRIVNPTLVVCGECDMLIPSLYAKQMADAIPNSEFMSIRHCGHDPLREQPEVVMPRIVEFLSRSSSNFKEADFAMEVVH